MHGDIGWHFPPTGGGRVDRFNDPGIAHFDGNPLVSLARETIQNSLDAKAGPGAVEVSFEIEKIDRRDSLGRDELAGAVTACLEELADDDDDDKARTMLDRASDLLRRDRLPYLRVSDRNTTGLRQRHWAALVKWQGASVKEKKSAGGSHGIGKYAPFAVSPLRTVYYWTRFDQNGTSRELFQGKAVLMSHAAPGTDGTETQGTGFYGIVDGCRELRDDSVPERIRRVERGPGRGNGTSLWIAGFRTDGDWQEGIARSVVANFFYAIAHDMLSVVIEPNDEMDDRGLMELDKSTIGLWFDYLSRNLDQKTPRTEDDEAIAEAWQFWDAIGSGGPSAEKQDGDLGHCRLWVRVSDGLPNKVGFVRRTGMLITTQQTGLLRFRGLKEFIAVCVFDSDKGNELLRMMENPQHDRFEPDRLPEHERARGKRALRRIVGWIREEISKLAAPPATGEATDLSELAQYLPDLEPDEEFDSQPRTDGEREPGFSGPSVVRLKPRSIRATSLPGELGTPDGDDGDHGGGGGDGDTEGGGGGGGGGGGRETVPISDVRLVAVPGQRNRYRVSFVAGFGGQARLEIGEAGDSVAIERKDLRAFGLDGKPLELDRVQLTEGERTTITITGTQPIGGRAWRVRAVRQEQP